MKGGSVVSISGWRGYLSHLIHSPFKTLVVFTLVAVFLAGPLVALYAMTVGRLLGSRQAAA